MKKTQLITVLKTFDKKETKEFAKWLASPLFNQRKDIVDLYKYLIQSNHLNEEKYLEKNRVFRKIFPASSFNDAKLRQTTHFLLKQVEKFLVYMEQEEDLFSQHLLLSKVYRKRKISSAFQKQMKISKNAFSETKQRNSHLLRLKYELTDEYITFIKEQPKQVNVNIQENIDALDIFFFAEKLKQACHVITYQKIFNLEYQIRVLDVLLETIKIDEQLLQQPSIAAYYHGYLMQIEKSTTEAEKHYFSLRKIVESELTAFQYTERRDIYLMTLNYCVGKMNAGQQRFIREAFDMYKKGLEDRIIIQDGTLSTIAYLNASSIALRLKEFDWTKKFIQEYTSFLEYQHQDNFKQYTLAKLLFEQKEYERAMPLLVQFESKHILVNLNAKSMLLKMYYEQDEVDALESLLDSLSIFLRRKDIIGYHKAVYQKTVKYTRKLLRLNPFDKEKRIALKNEIINASPLAESSWLLEQIDKM